MQRINASAAGEASGPADDAEAGDAVTAPVEDIQLNRAVEVLKGILRFTAQTVAGPLTARVEN